MMNLFLFWWCMAFCALGCGVWATRLGSAPSFSCGDERLCVCCCCLVRALSHFVLVMVEHIFSLSLCFVLMMEWYDHSLFVLVMDGFVCVVTWRPCSLFLFWWWGTFSFFLMMMMELYDHSLFCLGDGRLCVCYCLAVVLSLFVLVVGHDLPLSNSFSYFLFWW